MNLKDKSHKLKYIKHKSISGYTISSIKLFLGKEGFDQFQKWMFGETVGLYKGEEIIYKYDFDRFVRGLPPLFL